jgi:hypothetical protein
MTTRFNVNKLRIAYIQCVYGFRTIAVRNSIYLTNRASTDLSLQRRSKMISVGQDLNVQILFP